MLSFMPWAVMAIGSAGSGVIVDAALARGCDLTAVRRVVQTAAFMGPVVALLLLASKGAAASPTLAVLCLVSTLGVRAHALKVFVSMSSVRRAAT